MHESVWIVNYNNNNWAKTAQPLFKICSRVQIFVLQILESQKVYVWFQTQLASSHLYDRHFCTAIIIKTMLSVWLKSKWTFRSKLNWMFADQKWLSTSFEGLSLKGQFIGSFRGKSWHAAIFLLNILMSHLLSKEIITKKGDYLRIVQILPQRTHSFEKTYVLLELSIKLLRFLLQTQSVMIVKKITRFNFCKHKQF